MDQRQMRTLRHEGLPLLAVILGCTGLVWFFTGSSWASTTTVQPSALVSVADDRDHILVKFKDAVSASAQSTLLQTYDLQFVALLPRLNVNLFVASTGNEAEVLASLANHPLVEYAEPDYEYHAFALITPSAVTPNDPLFGQQWGLPAIKAPTAWDVTTGNREIIIAVVDSGVDLTHPDLAANLIQGQDFVFGNASPDDWYGHGTHVASIAAGTANNGEGVAGVAWRASIMPVRALNSHGSGRISDIAEGIVWATDQGADIINLSLGGTNDSRTLRDAIIYADDRDVLVVVAMGNEFTTGSPTNYPAAYAEVIAVGAIDQANRHATFSSSGSHIDVAAPGVEILAAAWRNTGDNYVAYSGTSMSTAFVSGLAALLLSINPDLSNQAIKSILSQSAVDLESRGWDSLTGAGLVDAAAAIAALPQPTEPTATPTLRPTATPTRIALVTPTAPAPITDTQSIKLYLPVVSNN